MKSSIGSDFTVSKCFLHVAIPNYISVSHINAGRLSKDLSSMKKIWWNQNLLLIIVYLIRDSKTYCLSCSFLSGCFLKPTLRKKMLFGMACWSSRRHGLGSGLDLSYHKKLHFKNLIFAIWVVKQRLTVSQILSNSGSQDAARWQFCNSTHVPFSTA